jgi:uncharacterized protein YndB with AHSA1/START domain
MSFDLRLERLIDATPQEAYDAFTDPDAMIEWYQDNPAWTVEVRECDARAGGTTTVAFGPGDERYIERMTYSVVEPPHRLVYEERFEKPDGFTFTTTIAVTFEEQAGKTLLTIVQTGFPNADERDGHQGGWPGFIDRLERVVARRRSM